METVKREEQTVMPVHLVLMFDFCNLLARMLLCLFARSVIVERRFIAGEDVLRVFLPLGRRHLIDRLMLGRRAAATANHVDVVVGLIVTRLMLDLRAARGVLFR